LGLGGHRKLITLYRHDCAIKCMTATRALMGGILKVFNSSEILPVYLINKLYSFSCGNLSATNTAYLVRFWGTWKICCGKPRNLANWPVEFGKVCCRKLWSYPWYHMWSPGLGWVIAQ